MYNNMLAVTSVNAKWDDKAPVLSTLHSTVTVHVQLFDLIGPAQSVLELPLIFMSTYFHEPEYATQTKMR